MTAPPAPSRIDRDAVLAAAGPELEALKSEVRGGVKALKRLGMFGWLFPVFFVASVFTPVGTGMMFLGFFALAVLVMIFGARIASRIFKARAGVMRALAPALGLTFEKRPAAPIDLSAFRGTYYGSLLKHTRAEDVLRGERRGAAFEIFDAKLTARSKGPDGKWRSGQPPKWLDGVSFATVRVARVAVPGRWTGRAVVVRDYGVANRLSQPQGMSRVGLVDRRFEKTFEVFATDQTEARALFDPALMERLQELEDIFVNTEQPAVGVFEHGFFLVALPITRSEEEGQKVARKTFAEIDDYVIDRIMWELDAVFGVVDAVAGREGGADVGRGAGEEPAP